MNHSKSRRQGGLLLKRKDIQAIIDEPDTYGIAFALKAPKQVEHVNLHVLKVSLVDGHLIGEVRQVPEANKKGVPGPLVYPTEECSAFDFHYKDKLIEDGYYFGFFSNFDQLFKGRDPKIWDEIFIGGGKKTYTEGAYSKDEWFTFSIAVRKSLAVHDFPNVELKDSPYPIRNQQSLIQLPLIEDIDSLTLSELENIVPAVQELKDKTVASFLKTNKSESITGIVFEDGCRLLLHKQGPATSIQLNENYKLKALHFGTSSTTILQEKLVELGDIFPYSELTIGCPPYWPRHTELGVSENGKNLRSAIEQALEKHQP